MMIRVVLADDHPIYRDGLTRSMADVGDIQIVGQARDGEQAAELVAQEKADVLLLDISMPKGGGIGALTRIMAMATPPRVAMLTASGADNDLMQAIKAGASWSPWAKATVRSAIEVRLRDLATVFWLMP